MSSPTRAKAARSSAGRALAVELAPRGIRVNAVAPRWIAREGHGFKDGEKTQAFRDYQVGLPIKRGGTPDDGGATVAFLPSNGASFITGQKAAISGGKTLL